jgi:hypothetical protein
MAGEPCATSGATCTMRTDPKIIFATVQRTGSFTFPSGIVIRAKQVEKHYFRDATVEYFNLNGQRLVIESEVVKVYLDEKTRELRMWGIFPGCAQGGLPCFEWNLECERFPKHCR